MHNQISVTDETIEDLKSKIEEKKRLKEYEELKKNLFEISYKANNTLTEFDGGLKQVDTDKALKSPYRKQTLSELIVARFLKMCAVRPIVGNLIALSLVITSIVCVFQLVNINEFEAAKIYIAYFLEMAAGIQIIKSASRSIILPITCVISGAIISNHMPESGVILQHHQVFFQCLMITGIIGLAISTFTID